MLNNLLQFTMELTGLSAPQVKLLGIFLIIFVVIVCYVVYCDEEGGGLGIQIVKEFNIEHALSDYAHEIMSAGTYKHRYAEELEKEIITYVRDMERYVKDLEKRVLNLGGEI